MTTNRHLRELAARPWYKYRAECSYCGYSKQIFRTQREDGISRTEYENRCRDHGFDGEMHDWRCRFCRAEAEAASAKPQGGEKSDG